MDQVTGAYKYSNSPTVYGTVGGKQYAFSNANDFTGLGGNFNNVQTIDGPANPNANIPIYSAQQNNSSNLNNIFSGVTPGVNLPGPTSQQISTAAGGLYSYPSQPSQPQQPQPQPAPQMQTYGQGTQTASLPPSSNAGSSMQLMNGEGLDASGQPIAAGTPNQFQAKLPGDVTSSGALGSGPSNGDINSALNNSNTQEVGMFSNLANLYGQSQQATQNINAAGTVGPAELAAQQQVEQAQLGVGQAQQNMQLATGQAQGFINPTGQPMDLPALTGQGALKQFNAQQGLISAQLQQQLAQTNLAYQQGNRQVAFATASKVYDASRQNLLDTLSVYTQTAPQNIGTTYNPLTGNITGTFRNPITGAETSAIVGNAGIQKSYVDSSVQSIFGIPTFVGVKADGSVDKIPLYNTTGQPNTQPTTAPTFQSTGSPQPGITTASALLGNWVNGPGTGNTPPGQGYQDAVYKTMSQLTGQNVNASTPSSTLANNIPALANSIAVAEGWNNPNSSQHQLNNPGNIIYAGQVNATPEVVQTTSGPRTFAKFSTEQQGWNAMYDLLGKKLGVSQTGQSSGGNVAPGTIQGSIQQLSQIAPPIGKAVTKSAFGHYYVDTTQLQNSQSLLDGATALVPSVSNGQIKVPTPDDARIAKSIQTTMSNIGNMESLIKALPTDPLDPQRAFNQIKANLGTDPTLARLQEMWQSVLPDLQAQIGSQGISRLATGFLSNPQLAITPTVSSIQSVAQAMLDQTKQLMSNREDSLFGGPSPIDYSAAASNLLQTSPQTSTYNTLNSLWGNIFGTQQLAIK